MADEIYLEDGDETFYTELDGDEKLDYENNQIISLPNQNRTILKEEYIPENEGENYFENRINEKVAKENIIPALQRMLVQPEFFSLSDRYEDLLKEAKYFEALGVGANLHLAIRLKKIRDERLYEKHDTPYGVKGYEDFQQFLRVEFPGSRDKAYKLIGVIENWPIEQLSQLKKFEYSKFTKYLPLIRSDKIDSAKREVIRKKAFEKIVTENYSENECSKHVNKLKNYYLPKQKIEFNPDRLVINNNNIELDGIPILTFQYAAATDFRRKLLDIIRQKYIKLNEQISYSESDESIRAMHIEDKKLFYLSESLKYGDIDMARLYLSEIEFIPLFRDDYSEHLNEMIFHVTKREVQKYRRKPYTYHYEVLGYNKKEKMYDVRRKPKLYDRWNVRNINSVVNALFSRDIGLIDEMLQKTELVTSNTSRIMGLFFKRLHKENLDPYDYYDVFTYLVDPNKYRIYQGLFDIQYGKCALLWSIEKKNFKLCKLLIEVGFPVNTEYETNEWSPASWGYNTSPLDRSIYMEEDLTAMLLERYLKDDISLTEMDTKNIIMLITKQKTKQLAFDFLERHIAKLKEKTLPPVKKTEGNEALEILNGMKSTFHMNLFKTKIQRALNRLRNLQNLISEVDMQHLRDLISG